MVPLAPILFQDDVIYGAKGIKEARIANARMDRVVKQLNLKLNPYKSVCTVIGSNTQRLSVQRELAANPLMCGEIETKLKDTFKWLGQLLSSKGLAHSVTETVGAREGKIRGACLEIVQIVNDWRTQAVGGMETALVLWEGCCIPSLLNGAGNWIGISAATEKKLNQLQYYFLRLALQVGPGASLAALSWDVMALDMGLRVYKEKILLVLFIRKLQDHTLAKQIYKEQRLRKWPGLVTETTQICIDLGKEDCNSTNIDLQSYKKILMKALHRKNEEKLRALAIGKCERLQYEEYGKKNYISHTNIVNVRQCFRSRFGLQSFGGNYSHDKRFAKTG